MVYERFIGVSRIQLMMKLNEVFPEFVNYMNILSNKEPKTFEEELNEMVSNLENQFKDKL
jgi:hypothetical protein